MNLFNLKNRLKFWKGLTKMLEPLFFPNVLTCIEFLDVNVCGDGIDIEAITFGTIH